MAHVFPLAFIFILRWMKKAAIEWENIMSSAFNKIFGVELIHLELCVCWTTITTVLISCFRSAFSAFILLHKSTCAHLIESDKNIFPVNDTIVRSHANTMCVCLSHYNQGTLDPLGMHRIYIPIKPLDVMHLNVLFQFNLRMHNAFSKNLIQKWCVADLLW